MGLRRIFEWTDPASYGLCQALLWSFHGLTMVLALVLEGSSKDLPKLMVVGISDPAVGGCY